MLNFGEGGRKTEGGSGRDVKLAGDAVRKWKKERKEWKEGEGNACEEYIIIKV